MGLVRQLTKTPQVGVVIVSVSIAADTHIRSD